MREVKKLKKYYRGPNKEAARLARAHAKAKVDDQEELFERALERGVLEQEIEGIISQSEFLNEKGIEADDIEEYVEQLLSAPETSRSHLNILKDALREQDSPDIADVVTYADGFGMDAETTFLKLEKLLRSGSIEPPDSIKLGDVEARVDEVLEIERTKDESNKERDSTDPSPTSQRGILEQAVREHNEGPVSAILNAAENKGLPRDVAVLHLEKLARSGQIHVDIPLSEIEEAADGLLNIHETDKPQAESEKESTSSSQREIIEDAVGDQDDRSLDEVIGRAKGQGMTEKQILAGLEKMLLSGQIIGHQYLDLVRVRERRQALSKSSTPSKQDNKNDGAASKNSNLSQQDIIRKPIEDMASPTREDVLNFAVEHGMSREKAESRLSKLIAMGDVSRSADRTLRLL